MKNQLQASSFWDKASFPVAVAHRGGDGAGLEKENSLKAFKSAYYLGYRWFETDIVPTSDGELLAIHGRGLQKKANKDLPNRLRIQSMTFAEAKKNLRVGGEEPLTLKELLDTFPDANIFIDPKTYKAGPALADLLLSRPEDLDRVCVGSFHGRNTRLINRRIKKALNREITCAAIGSFRGTILIISAIVPFFRPVASQIVRRRHIKTYYLPHKQLIGQKGISLIDFAGKNNLKIVAYTPNDSRSIRAVIEAGVAAVMSDNVKLLKNYIKP